MSNLTKQAMDAVDKDDGAVFITNTPRAGEREGARERMKNLMALEPTGDQPVKHEGTDPANDVNNRAYIDLYRIIRLAYDQASVGKGKQRHAAGPVGIRTWDKQPIMEIGRMVGPGYASGQVMKKVQEVVTMCGNGNFQGAKAEALGAIVYSAALHKLIEEIEAAHDRPLGHVTI